MICLLQDTREDVAMKRIVLRKIRARASIPALPVNVPVDEIQFELYRQGSVPPAGINVYGRYDVFGKVYSIDDYKKIKTRNK